MKRSQNRITKRLLSVFLAITIVVLSLCDVSYVAAAEEEEQVVSDHDPAETAEVSPGETDVEAVGTEASDESSESEAAGKAEAETEVQADEAADPAATPEDTEENTVEVEVGGISYSGTTFDESEGDLIVSSTKKTTLSENATYHDVTVMSDLDLNGHTLTVTGHLYHRGGDINIGGGKLIINGNYEHQTSIGEKTTGTLKMINANDRMTVGGNFVYRVDENVIGCKPSFSKGELHVKGDYTQTAKMLTSNAVHKIVLEGEGEQTVDISTTGTAFNVLEIAKASDGSVRDIVWNGSMNVNCFVSDANITAENLRIVYANLNGYNLKVSGNVISTGNIDFNSGTLDIPGNLYHRSGDINIGGGKLYIGGNYEHQTADGEKTTGTLEMLNANDRMTVGGNFVYRVDENVIGCKPSFSKGELHVKGDYTQTAKMLTSNVVHKIVLEGEGTQTVDISTAGTAFNLLEIAKASDGSDRNIVWKGSMNVNRFVSNASITAESLRIVYANLYGYKIKVSGNVISTGNIDFNSGTLDIPGNLYHRSGDINIGGGKLYIGGNYEHQTAGGEKTTGTLEMLNANDRMTVGGNFVYKVDENTIGCKPSFSKGELHVKGDYTQTAKMLTSNAVHKIVLEGEGKQTVDISTAGTAFNLLEIAKAADGSDRNIVWKGSMNVNRFVSNASITAENLQIVYANLYGYKVKVSGNVTSTGDIDFNGGTLDIAGNLYHRSGTVTLGGGKLYIGGNYEHQTSSGEKAGGKLVMNNVKDEMTVTGNFLENGTGSNISLYNGVLNVGGNFTQLGTTSCISSREAHTTVLNGAESQTVKFEAANGKFGTLKLTKTFDNYTFTPDQCWIKLITLEDVLNQEYTITYNVDGGTNAESNPGKYKSDSETITLADPTKTGYTFGGWYSEETFTNKVTEITKGSKGNKTFYAKWTANTYTIKFVGNSSTGGSMASMSISYDEELILTANGFTRKNSDFAGWNTEADGTGTMYADKAAVKNLTAENGAEFILYARWQFKPGKYKITYNLNGGTNNELNPDRYGEDWESFTLADPTKEGYTFVGWYKSKTKKAKKKVTEIAQGSQKDLTVYAIWTANKYTVTFDQNGGTKGKMTAMKNKVYGKKFALKANKFKRTGYTFTGWNTKADGTGISYRNKEKVMNLTAESKGTIILYAQWKEK